VVRIFPLIEELNSCTIIQRYNHTIWSDDEVMNIALDFRSDTPLYEQIISQIKHLIVTEALLAGEQLPTIRDLASELDINFNTVARSYRSLDAEGLISTQRGRGTFVLGYPKEGALADLRQENFKYLTQTYLSKSRSLGYSLEEIKKLFHEYLKQVEEE